MRYVAVCTSTIWKNLCIAALLVFSSGSVWASQDAATEPGVVLAVVGGESVTVATFRRFLAAYMRGRLFHGGADEARTARLHQEALNAFLDHVRLRQEAQRRGLSADPALVSERVARRMHTRSGSDAKDILESDIGEELLIEQLRVVVRGNNQPSPDAVTAYYQANPGRFTLPERVRVSVILLKVPPYAAASEWQARMKEAQSLRQRIIEGGDFAVIARERSEHESATQGGSLGLVHSGMLTQELQQIVDKLQVGELAEASAILQGIVLLRLDERQPSALMPLERARERARRLLEDEEGERAWQALVVQLRETVPVKLLQEAP